MDLEIAEKLIKLVSESEGRRLLKREPTSDECQAIQGAILLCAEFSALLEKETGHKFTAIQIRNATNVLLHNNISVILDSKLN